MMGSQRVKLELQSLWGRNVSKDHHPTAAALSADWVKLGVETRNIKMWKN